MSDDLDFIAPLERKLTIDGVELTITPLVVEEIAPVIRATSPFISTLLYGVESLDVARLVELLGEHGDAVIEAVAICARREKRWVGKLLLDRLTALALVCVEVNADFFSRALTAAKAQAPKLAPNVAQKIKAGTWLGTKPSSASSPPATATAT